MLITGIAWGIASTNSIAQTVRLTLLFVFVHFLAVSLLLATAAFFLVGRLLGPGIAGLPGKRRQQGLFTQAGEGEQLEFGYCFDVGGYLQGISLHQLNGTGGNTSVFPRLGTALRRPVYIMATNSIKPLVRFPHPPPSIPRN